MDSQPPKRPVNTKAAAAILGGLAVFSLAAWSADRNEDRRDRDRDRRIEQKVERAIAKVDRASVVAKDGGGVSVSIPGVGVNVDVPGVKLGDNLDMMGFPPFPGTKVKSLNVDKSSTDGKTKGEVEMDFATPAPQADVLAYYAGKLRDKGFAIEQDGNQISGKTKDGDRFELEVDSEGDKASTGTLTFTKD